VEVVAALVTLAQRGVARRVYDKVCAHDSTKTWSRGAVREYDQEKGVWDDNLTCGGGEALPSAVHWMAVEMQKWPAVIGYNDKQAA
jgi:hypothetical protein